MLLLKELTGSNSLGVEPDADSCSVTHRGTPCWWEDLLEKRATKGKRSVHTWMGQSGPSVLFLNCLPCCVFLLIKGFTVVPFQGDRGSKGVQGEKGVKGQEGPAGEQVIYFLGYCSSD